MKLIKTVLVVALSIGAALSTTLAPAASATTRRQEVVASRHGIYRVHFRPWTRNYPWVHIHTATQYGSTGPEPVQGIVRISCEGGWRHTSRWFDGDGRSNRTIYIRPDQGRCYESVTAWTDDGARLSAALLVHHYPHGSPTRSG